MLCLSIAVLFFVISVAMSCQHCQAVLKVYMCLVLEVIAMQWFQGMSARPCLSYLVARLFLAEEFHWLCYDVGTSEGLARNFHVLLCQGSYSRAGITFALHKPFLVFWWQNM